MPDDGLKEVYLSITLTDLQLEAVENTTGEVDLLPLSLTFDVVPMEKEANGAKGTPIDNVQGNIVFRLPIPHAINSHVATYAKVDHQGEVSYYTIQTYEATGDRYIDVSATHFSPFTVTFLKTLPSTGSGVTVGSSGSSGGGSYRDGEYDFWMKVKSKIQSADPGDTVKVDAKGYDRMPYAVMEALKEADGVTLTVSWNGGKTFTIPAKAALAESSRIYYPLSYLAGYDFGEGEAASVGSHGNPETGGILEVTAPAAADAFADPTAPELGLASGGTGGLVEADLPMAPDEVQAPAQAAEDPAGKSAVLPVLLAAGAALLLAGMGVWLWKRRDQA